MAKRLDLIAPYPPEGSSALMVQRWLKNIGDPVLKDEPILELVGSHAVIYIHSPAEGVVSAISVVPGQNVLSGSAMGHITYTAKDEVEWETFDEVAETLEKFAEESRTSKELRDANEALGQLFGITDNPVFRTLNIDQQNKFLQRVSDQQKQNGMSPAAVAQALLEGLALRMPANAPRAPSLGLGLRGPSAPGLGTSGGGYAAPQYPQQMQQQPMVPQPGAYPAYPAYPASQIPGQVPGQMPPQYPGQVPPQGYPQYPQQHNQGGYPPQAPQQGYPVQQGVPPVIQQPPAQPQLPPQRSDDEESK